ncbi:hypothetical protein IMF22_02590 [Pseudomonas poae]|uniref:Uncharacterized protein n=1 Tax=Pseudomonas poae TaxID=200451 RepID=A0A7M1KIN1_9PSED|nr:hypothetical protein [Pseudomonas poae]QOQ75984.1 hypothetical protein IMF22_02590 [Pseudomonas poae]
MKLAARPVLSSRETRRGETLKGVHNPVALQEACCQHFVSIQPPIALLWLRKEPLKHSRIEMKASLLILSVVALLSGCASSSTAVAPDLSLASIAETKSVVFNGKTFVLKYQKNGLWEYFPEQESVDAWTEMLDFTVVPLGDKRIEPLDLGQRTVQLHQQENPDMPAVLTTDNKTGILYLMLFFPSSLRKDGHFSEYSFFKYYRDSGTGQIIIFHFARNVAAKSQTPEERWESTTEIGHEIVPVIKAFPKYRP